MTYETYKPSQDSDCSDYADDVATAVANAVRLTHGQEAYNYVMEIAYTYCMCGLPIISEDELMKECSDDIHNRTLDQLENRIQGIQDMADAHWDYKNGRTTIDGYPMPGYIQLADGRIVEEE